MKRLLGVLAVVVGAAWAGACGGGSGAATDLGTVDASDPGPGDVADSGPGETTGAPICAVRDFGAVGDGTTLDTAAIQAAVDACAGTGGTVVVAPGSSPGIYYTGTIWLKSGTWCWRARARSTATASTGGSRC